jgi:hypothetical protein
LTDPDIYFSYEEGSAIDVFASRAFDALFCLGWRLFFMQTTTRLLLPFTEGIHAQALSSAVQLAKQSGATLVALALILLRLGKQPRLELVQQAQDFLVLTQHKAEQQGVPIETSQISTYDVARSIEVFASEMSCEKVLLFINGHNEVLLKHAEIRTLMDRLVCNIHLVLLPQKRRCSTSKLPLHLLLLKRGRKEMYDADSDFAC